MAKRIPSVRVIRKPNVPATQAEIDRFIAVYYCRDEMAYAVAINDLLAGRERKQKAATRISAAQRRVVEAAVKWAAVGRQMRGSLDKALEQAVADLLKLERAKGDRK
jgi:hypothetical protein